MEKAEINRQIAEMMGIRINVFDGGKLVDTWWKWDFGVLGISAIRSKDEPQDYCTDPAASDQVRSWLEGEGLWIEEVSYMHKDDKTGEVARRYFCTLRGPGRPTWSAKLCLSRGEALCKSALVYAKSEHRGKYMDSAPKTNAGGV